MSIFLFSKKVGLIGGALALVSMIFGCGNSSPVPGDPLVEGKGAAADLPLEHAAKHLNPRYVCPMHPQIVREAPGSCPICGMNLVEKRLDSGSGKPPEVVLTAAVQQNLGVRTARVERGTLWKLIRSIGRVDYDETRIAHVHPRASGWIEALQVRAEGESVTRGQELAQLYAPDILSAQVDFLLALAPPPRGVAQVQADKARNLLRLLAVPDDVIREIERRGETRNTVPVRAPIPGVVTRLNARDGMYVSPGSEMFTIVDLSQVWVLVDIFESQIDWLAPGLTAEIRVPAYPGRIWQGTLDYLYPELDPKTRTLRVRLVFDNPEGRLRPNMFAEAVIYGGPRRGVLKIPREALIVTGVRESVVRALGGGGFQPVEVVTGMQRDGEVEILSGLEEDHEIVLSGQFLIDSEASLQASFQRLEGVSEKAEGKAHAH